jgi:hypothetical protein
VLRITTKIDLDATRFLVEGKLAGPCVNELEKCWRTISPKSAAPIFIDLSSVTFIDATGKRLLAVMHAHGTRLTASGLFANCVIKEIVGSSGHE